MEDLLRDIASNLTIQELCQLEQSYKTSAKYLRNSNQYIALIENWNPDPAKSAKDNFLALYYNDDKYCIIMMINTAYIWLKWSSIICH